METSLGAKPETAPGAEQNGRSEFTRDIESDGPSHGTERQTSSSANSDLVPEKRDDSMPASFDQSAEAEFLAEARGRGELVAAARRVAGDDEETDSQNTPSLDELVKRIPQEIRETLDELFRVKFVRVQRVPPDALKK